MFPIEVFIETGTQADLWNSTCLRSPFSQFVNLYGVYYRSVYWMTPYLIGQPHGCLLAMCVLTRAVCWLPAKHAHSLLCRGGVAFARACQKSRATPHPHHRTSAHQTRHLMCVCVCVNVAIVFELIVGRRKRDNKEMDLCPNNNTNGTYCMSVKAHFYKVNLFRIVWNFIHRSMTSHVSVIEHLCPLAWAIYEEVFEQPHWCNQTD